MGENQKNTILIVDDEPTCIKLYIHMLSSDYSLYVAKDGQSAIDVAVKRLPDLILLDVDMPGMNGFEVLSSLKALDATKTIPTIFVTGHNNHEDIERGLNMGAVGFISKTSGSEIIKSEIANHFCPGD